LGVDISDPEIRFPDGCIEIAYFVKKIQ